MLQETVNRFYDKIDELRETFDIFLDGTSRVNAITGALEMSDCHESKMQSVLGKIEECINELNR